MAKNRVYGDTLTVELSGECVFLKHGAAQSIVYIFQQLRGIRDINQFGKYSSQTQATTVIGWVHYFFLF